MHLNSAEALWKKARQIVNSSFINNLPSNLRKRRSLKKIKQPNSKKISVAFSPLRRQSFSLILLSSTKDLNLPLRNF